VSSLTHISEGFYQVRDIVLPLLASCDYVVDIRKHISTDLILQNCLRHSLESWTCVAEPLQHSEVAICSEWSDETGLFFIFYVKPDLVIPVEIVQ
jgi:hypothetical protein